MSVDPECIADPIVLQRLEKRLETPLESIASSLGIESFQDYIWALGIEMEGTYVLNPLDTKKKWKDAFKKIYVPDYWDIHKWAETDSTREKKYPFLADEETVESSGRFCGKYVVFADPIDSILEISTKQAYGVTAFRPFFATDVLWYPSRIEELQSELIDELNRMYKKYPKFQKQDKIYRSIIPYPYGMTDKQTPAQLLFDPRKRAATYTNYTGSYHVTITLPFRFADTTVAEYREMYKRYINQIQWVEPFLLALYSSVDMRGIGSSKKLPRSSYRIMMTGWGNPGGSDVRELDKGFTRYSGIPLYWRKGLHFPGVEKLNSMCGEGVKRKWPKFSEQHPEAISAFGTDIRTFWRSGFKGEVPVSGAPIEKLFGIEIRIFDYFPPKNLYSLCRFLVYLAENSRRVPAKEFVYQDKAWIGAMHAIMKQGWRAKLPINYVIQLEKALGLKFPEKPRKVSHLWKMLLKVLWQNNKDGWFVKVMLPQKFHGDPNKEERTDIPLEARTQPPLVFRNVNRESWEFGFLLKLVESKTLQDKLISFLDLLPADQISRSQLEKLFHKRFSRRDWADDFEDIIYFFAHRGALDVIEDNDGFLKGIVISSDQINQAISIVENHMGELIKLWPELLLYAEGGEVETES